MPNETGAEILARIKPKLDEDWTEICLRPDLVAEFEELESDLVEAQTRVGPRRNADGITKRAIELAKKVEAARELIEESAVKFHFRALSRDAFRDLTDRPENAPRRGDQVDMMVGYNRDAVGDALVRASMVEPTFDDDSWPALVEVVSIGEWNRLRQVAEKVNGSVVTESPKSQLASRILSSHAASSKPQPTSE
jgi:hypothetical protein